MFLYIKHNTSKLCSLALLSSLFSGLSTSALTAENEAADSDWQPRKTITIMAPSNPGGGWDQTARFIQHAITTEDMVSVAVEVVNRGGAGGTIALAELVERYAGDPHKLMIGGFGMTGAVLMHGSDHALLSATPIARLTGEYQALAVPVDSKIQTVFDLIKLLNDNPVEVSWGGGSAGGADHIFAALFAEKAGIDPSVVNYVAFTGGGEAAAALMGGQVTVGVSGFSEWNPLVAAGRVRLLAVSSATRLVDPDLVTFKELGIDIVFQNWRAILAAPGITAGERAWLTALITEVRHSKTWQGTLQKNNWQDSFLIGTDFEKFIEADSVKTEAILSRIGLGAGGKGYAAVGPYFFPTIVASGLLLSALLLILGYIREKDPAALQETSDGTVTPDPKRFMKAVAALFLYAAAIQQIGFLYVTPIFILVMAWLIGSKSPTRDLIVGVVLAVLVTLVFENLLGVDIP